MGVSLERVQFKFASIIGELCSEPDVLSQFAVWLDLRLAEYKLKGAISLDCSGEEPDPIWLKGLNKGHRKLLDPSNQQIDNRIPGINEARSRGSVSQSPSGDRTVSHPKSLDDVRVSEQYSPDIVVIKDEASDVYPVCLRQNSHTNSPVYESHKRTAANSFSDSNSHWSHGSSPQETKRWRRTSTTDSPSNQSLMSVIGVSDEVESATEIHEPSDRGDNSNTCTSAAGVSSPVACSSSAEMSMDFSDTSINTSQSLQDIGYVEHAGTIPEKEATSVENQGLSEDRSRIDVYRSIPPVGIPAHSGSPQNAYRLNSTGYLERAMWSRELANKTRKSKICKEKLAGIPRQTLTSMAAAAGTFERWLWRSYANERRGMTDLPPTELNQYLTEFFQKIVTPNGVDYKPESFVALKCYLSRYLKETNYPEFLSHSPVFQSARNAFQVRRLNIKCFSTGTVPDKSE